MYYLSPGVSDGRTVGFLPIKLDQIRSLCPQSGREKFGASMDTEFGINMLQMDLDGLNTDSKSISNVLVRTSFHKLV